MIKAALNGNRSRDEHGAIPITPLDLSLEARRAVEAGAAALHVHPRDSAGRESLAIADVAAALSAIRAVCPDVPLGVSTGAWIEPDVSRRLALLADWTGPDFASVNFDELGAEAVARLLLTLDIDVEAGLSTVEAARAFAAFDRARDCLRVLIEPQESETDQAEVTIREIESVLDESSMDLPRLLHGTESTTWALIRIANARGYDTRIGFEDTLVLPDGTLAASNGELVQAAYRSGVAVRAVEPVDARR